MTELKRHGIVMFCAVSVCLITIFGTMALYMWEYRRAPFVCLSAFCENLIAEHPETEQAVLDALKQQYSDSDTYGLEKADNAIREQSDYYGEKKVDNIFLTQYGYREEDFSRNVPVSFVVLSVSMIVLIVCGLLFIWFYPKKYNRARIAELTDYLEGINVGGADVRLLTKEDEFSHLQDEMYKTVTELYRTREQAVEAKVNYADNLANIAHQLKTPITAAFLSISEISRFYMSLRNKFHNRKMSDSLQLIDQSEEYTKRIRKQLERLQNLEEALLTLSKIDAGVLKLAYADVDIYTVLSLAADNINDLLLQKNLSVSIPEKGCVTFKGDMEWFMEAVMNLMKNCMEHSPQNGTIYCDYLATPLYAEIRIWDEGKGFAAEDIPHLFERFYRGNNYYEKEWDTIASEQGDNGDTHKKDTNVGIGLSLSRSIIELHNGTITARNLPQGGACFEIKIYSH